MSSELKWGVILGVIVAVAAVLYFVQGGKESEPPEFEEAPPASNTDSGVRDTDVTETEPPMSEPPQPEPVKIIQDAPSIPPQDDVIVPVPVAPAPEPTPVQTEKEIKPVASEPPKSVIQEPRYYIVKKGDTLTQISELYYGEARFWKVIEQANKNIISNPNLLKEGWKLRIPYPDEVTEKVQ